MGGKMTGGVKLIALCGAVTVVAACSVGPDYVRPKEPVPAAFKEMSGWKRAQPREAQIRGTWWDLYNDRQLATLMDQVPLSNQNVASAEAQFRQARALVRVARSGYFPTITAGASVTRSRRPTGVSGGAGTTVTGPGGSVTTSSSVPSAVTATEYLLPVDASWELDLWGGVRRRVEANEATAQATWANLEALRLSIQAELAQDYFQLRSLDAQKELLDRTVVAYADFLQLTRNRSNAGVASMADVYQAEAQLKNAQSLQYDIGLQRAQFEHAIALLIGRPGSLFTLPPLPLAGVPPAIPTGVPSELLERRPDVAAAERRMAAANAQIGVAEAAFFPTITLSASAGFQASDLSKWLTWPSRFWSLGADVAETVFSGGLRGAEVEAARAAWDASVADYRETVLTAFQEVEDNLAALRILEDEWRAQDEALRAAQQSTVITMNQYRAGVVSYLNVIVAQTNELASARNAISILGRRQAASVLLIKALGGGWSGELRK